MLRDSSYSTAYRPIPGSNQAILMAHLHANPQARLTNAQVANALEIPYENVPWATRPLVQRGLVNRIKSDSGAFLYTLGTPDTPDTPTPQPTPINPPMSPTLADVATQPPSPPPMPINPPLSPTPLTFGVDSIGRLSINDQLALNRADTLALVAYLKHLSPYLYDLDDELTQN